MRCAEGGGDPGNPARFISKRFYFLFWTIPRDRQEVLLFFSIHRCPQSNFRTFLPPFFAHHLQSLFVPKIDKLCFFRASVAHPGGRGCLDRPVCITEVWKRYTYLLSMDLTKMKSLVVVSRQATEAIPTHLTEDRTEAVQFDFHWRYSVKVKKQLFLLGCRFLLSIIAYT